MVARSRLPQDAAVIGKVFWSGAVLALGGTPGDGELDEQLHGLERGQFVRRDRASSVAGQAQYAFVHVLVRDVAYGQIPRAARCRCSTRMSAVSPTPGAQSPAPDRCMTLRERRSGGQWGQMWLVR
jgi:hypothetical protein